jgi:hypothetical protein
MYMVISYENHQQGQVGLLVVLLMTVMLTVGVGVVKRSTEDVKISREEEEASQIFNTAEKGIESAMLEINKSVASPGTAYQTTGTVTEAALNTSASYTITEEKKFDMLVNQGESGYINVSNNAGNSKIRIDWGLGQVCTNPMTGASIVIMIYNKNDNTARRYAYAGCDRGTDGFDPSAGSGPVGPPNYLKSVAITLRPDDQLVKVRPFYNSSNIRVQADPPASWDMGTQFYKVTSVGTKTGFTDTTKVIQVERSIPMAPSIFDFALFAGRDIVKSN